MQNYNLDSLCSAPFCSSICSGSVAGVGSTARFSLPPLATALLRAAAELRASSCAAEDVPVCHGNWRARGEITDICARVHACLLSFFLFLFFFFFFFFFNFYCLGNCVLPAPCSPGPVPWAEVWRDGGGSQLLSLPKYLGRY